MGDVQRKNVTVYDCVSILSIDSFKKSFRDPRSALGNLATRASRAVLKKPHTHTDHRQLDASLGIRITTHFFVTVIRSCVLR